MDFKYEIPTHLEPYLADMDVKALNKMVTMLFEFAVNHRLLDYPKLHIERQVDDIVHVVSQLLTQNDKLVRTFSEEMRELKAQVEKMSMVRIESTYTPSAIYAEGTEELEDGGEESFFTDLKKPVQTTEEAESNSVEELIDDILA